MSFTSASASVLGREAMRQLDARTIDAGTHSAELMERAGAALAAFLSDPLASGVPVPDRATHGPVRLLVLAGRGNNGGDGLVVARLLAAEGWRCTVALVGGEPSLGTDADLNLGEWQRIGGQVVDRTEALRLLEGGAPGFDLGLDAIFGTGLVRPIEGADLELINSINKSGLPLVAADVPSGLCSDTGRPLGAAVRARATLAIGAAKPGLFLAEGPDHAGRVKVADIGLLEPAHVGLKTAGVVLDAATMASSWPRLEPLAHKGSRGHVLVVAGSRGKSGAAVLAARAALRAGAGLVTVASVAEVQAAVAAALPEAMTRGLASDPHGQIDTAGLDALAAELRTFDSIVVGPGLGTGPGVSAMVERLLATPAPVVLDADALNVLSGWHEGRRRGVFKERAASGAPAAILTPHPGEMGRLVGRSTESVQQERNTCALNLAKMHGVVVVLKGAGTIVCETRRLAYNLSGNAGMATAGMGDVLSGICGAVAARIGVGALAGPFQAACLAVYVHGAAGDALAARTGPGFLASELADVVPEQLALRWPR